MEKLYRPNVAALIVRADGLLLVCERSAKPGAWQFPQGGIDPGESAQVAVQREIREEVGFDSNQYDLISSRSGYRYDYPPEVLQFVREKRKQAFVGQEQEYFLCRLHEDAPDPILDNREFCRYRWIEPSAFERSWLPDFKKEVYTAVMKDFFDVSLS